MVATSLFSVCRFFAVCFSVADGKELLCRPLADGKDMADGKVADSSSATYTHNYAQFYQLLNSNLFTHRRILLLLIEATSETYGPRVYSHHINLHYFIYLLCFYFAFYFLLCISISKIPKKLFIISIRSHPRK